MNRSIFSIIIAIAAVAACACEAPEPNVGTENRSEVYLTYASAGAGADGTGGAPRPFDACTLTGPGETIVLATLAKSFDVTLYGPCETDRDFRWGYFRGELDVIRSHGEQLPANVGDTIWFPSSLNLNVSSSTPAGTRVLASLRRAGSDWIVTSAVVVDDSSPQSSAESSDAYTRDGAEIVLPSSWSDIVQQASTVQADYANECADFRSSAGTREMSDDEFDTFVHQVPAKPQCDAEQAKPGADAG